MNGESERLGPVAQALVENGRASDAPTDDDRARVRLRLTAALGVSALSVVGTQAAAASLAVEGAAGAAVNGASVGAGAAASSVGAGALGAVAASGATVATGVSTGHAALGSAVAASTGTVAGTQAGAAAVGGGIFAALGSKVLVASVLAATAVGGAVGTEMFLRDAGRATGVQTSGASRADPNASPKAVEAPTIVENIAHRSPGSLEPAQPPLKAAAQSGLGVSSTAAQAVASAARATPAAARLNPPAAASGTAAPGGTRTATASATAPTSSTPEIGRNAVKRANGSKAQVSASGPAPSADARATTNPIAAAAPSNEAEAPPSNAAVAAPSPSAAGSGTESASGAAPAPTAGRDSNAAATAPAATPPSTAASSNPSGAKKPPALSGELKLLASAQHALRDNQLPRALELLNQHAARYPAGALRPERCAARAVVFCRMGEKNLGRAEVQKLEAETPTSPLVRWAKDVCGLR